MTIHESSPCNHGASIKLKNQCKKYISSHFYQDKHIGINVNGHLNEDLENQTFKDESFDLIITQDVMEHVYDPAHAFSEIARTLKNGGEHILTVPLVNKHKPTEVWAVKGKDSKPIFLKKPEYHVIQLTQTVPR
ncbi:MAG: class I SAM-dependent methyltransferase [Candidatus Woesearchaeota archaeon]